MATMTKNHRLAMVEPLNKPNALAVKFIVDFDDLDGQPTEYKCLWVGRVFLEAGRAILCWRSVNMENTATSQPPVLHEQGWGVARPLFEPNGTKFTFRTRYFMPMEPSVCLPTSEHGRLFEKFADYLTTALDREALDWLEAMENVVLNGVDNKSMVC